MESEKEIEAKELLKKGENILDDSHLTTKEGREILDIGYSILQAYIRVRESRDSWREKFEELKK